jgi:predicted dinucleotide-binding enzyme
VKVGSRTEGDGAVVFADAAAHGELVFNCTSGVASLDALAAAGAGNLAGKTLIDVSNPLDFSGGGPALFTDTTDSLGERIQAAFPDARVVKAFNTINCNLMVDPSLVPGDHVVFVAGNDDAAKEQTGGLAREFGWPPERVIDLGDITAARGTEHYLILWLRLMGAVGGPQFNIAVNR